MSQTLAAGPTSLDRLETAIARMVQKHGFVRVDRDDALPPGPCVLLVTEDPLRNPEVLDACVILPEALRAAGDEIARRVAGPEAAATLQQRYGFARPPAAVFLRDGEYHGCLTGIRDWAEYRDEIGGLLNSPAQRRPIAIALAGASAGGRA